MYDAEDPGAVVNEFLITLFVPGAVTFVALWASFRLLFDDTLRSSGLVPLTPAPGAGVVGTGFGRMVLLVLLTSLVLAPYLGLYLRFLRTPLRERGLV